LVRITDHETSQISCYLSFLDINIFLKTLFPNTCPLFPNTCPLFPNTCPYVQIPAPYFQIPAPISKYGIIASVFGVQFNGFMSLMLIPCYIQILTLLTPHIPASFNMNLVISKCVTAVKVSNFSGH
jgi:hypothetical protein